MGDLFPNSSGNNMYACVCKEETQIQAYKSLHMASVNSSYVGSYSPSCILWGFDISQNLKAKAKAFFIFNKCCIGNKLDLFFQAALPETSLLFLIIFVFLIQFLNVRIQPWSQLADFLSYYALIVIH